MTGLLLDTCAVIWLVNGSPMSADARDCIVQAALGDGVFVSPVSAWEIGLLAAPRSGPGVTFQPDPKAWFARMMRAPGIRLAPFTADIAIDSAVLPGDFHRDPGDRLIVATARDMGVPIVTRDAKILDYASAGHVSAIPC